MTLQGHPRSLILAPTDINSNLGPTLPRFRHIGALYAKSHFFDTPPLFRPKFWVFPLEYIRDVGPVESNTPN